MDRWLTVGVITAEELNIGKQYIFIPLYFILLAMSVQLERFAFFVLTDLNQVVVL